jgi:ubiquitin-like domain-containing CTD phosphatase 1
MGAVLCRPHLHAFLTAVYPSYDIVIWSANSMKWMNVKMKALGVLDNENFKITFMLDYRAMLTVCTSKYGA